MTNEPNINHLATLFRDAHWRSLDSICSHPLEAEDIENERYIFAVQMSRHVLFLNWSPFFLFLCWSHFTKRSRGFSNNVFLFFVSFWRSYGPFWSPTLFLFVCLFVFSILQSFYPEPLEHIFTLFMNFECHVIFSKVFRPKRPKVGPRREFRVLWKTDLSSSSGFCMKLH